jgi:hypothetical protein
VIGFMPCRLPAGWQEIDPPPMHLVRQRFLVPPVAAVEAEIERQWEAAWASVSVRPGASIAVGVGSRGIDRLPEVVRKVVAKLRQAGCRPFIVSAMGSHGGATPEGQSAVLAERGITEESVAAPIRASVDVVELGEAHGLPLVLDRAAAEADGIVLINRVKPHTDFVGHIESGLTKMLVVGLGNEVGATIYHRHALERGLADVVVKAGSALLERARVLLGVALLENQRHEVTTVRLLPAAEWESSEPELLARARELVPRLPIDEIDVLLVDEMGKDVSGAGMDPNVTGRSTGCWTVARQTPRITRIVALSLTRATHGNACGLGSVDVAPRRLVEQIDLGATMANALASCAPEDGKIPLWFESDREALVGALGTVRPCALDDLRLVHIRSTLALGQIEVSPGCLPHLTESWPTEVSPEAVPLAFGDGGRLRSRLL